MLGRLSHAGFGSGGGCSPGLSSCPLNSSDLQNRGTNIPKPLLTPRVPFGDKQEAFGKEQPFPVPSPCS